MSREDAPRPAATRQGPSRGAANRGWRKLVLDFAVYLVLRSCLCVVQALSPRQVDSLAHGLAWLLCDVARVRHRVVDDNLRHAFPEWNAKERRTIERGMWRHLMRLVGEVVLARRKIHETNWRDYFELVGISEFIERLLSGRPILLVTGHFGNFELGGYVAGLLGCRTYTLARELDNPFLDRFLREFREGTGQRLFDTRGTSDLAQAVLQAGGALAILADHHGGDKGIWVDFFGRPASCHKSIAVFSLANGVPLSILTTTRRDRLLHFRVRCVGTFDPQANHDDPRLDPTTLTQWFTRCLESEIRTDPRQYWWLHKRWKPRTRRPSRKGSVGNPQSGQSPDGHGHKLHGDGSSEGAGLTGGT